MKNKIYYEMTELDLDSVKITNELHLDNFPEIEQLEMLYNKWLYNNNYTYKNFSLTKNCDIALLNDCLAVNLERYKTNYENMFF